MTKEEEGKVIWKAMEILMRYTKEPNDPNCRHWHHQGSDKQHKLDTAFQLRVIYDVHYRDPDGHWIRR